VIVDAAPARVVALTAESFMTRVGWCLRVIVSRPVSFSRAGWLQRATSAISWLPCFPVRGLPTVRVHDGGVLPAPAAVKVAVTVSAARSLIAHVPVPEQPPPLQPVNLEPAAADARPAAARRVAGHLERRGACAGRAWVERDLGRAAVAHRHGRSGAWVRARGEIGCIGASDRQRAEL
jgi:hypothetical protein